MQFAFCTLYCSHMNEKMFASQPQENPEAIDAFADTLTPPPESTEHTLRQAEPQFTENETLRSTKDFDLPAESGMRKKNFDSFAAQGVSPVSDGVKTEEIYDMKEEVGVPSNFKISSVPSYEISAMGTIPSPDNAGAPNEPSEILRKDTEKQEKRDDLVEFIAEEKEVPKTLKSAGEEMDEQQVA